MPYERTEVSAQEIERQKEICARVRSALGSGERFAMVDTYGCQQNESDSEVLRGYLQRPVEVDVNCAGDCCADRRASPAPFARALLRRFRAHALRAAVQ